MRKVKIIKHYEIVKETTPEMVQTGCKCRMCEEARFLAKRNPEKQGAKMMLTEARQSQNAQTLKDMGTLLNLMSKEMSPCQ